MGMNDAFSGRYRRMRGGGYRQFVDEATRRQEQRKRTRPLRDSEKFVRLVELFVRGPRNSLARYVAKAGRKIVVDTDNLVERRRVPMPIGRAIYDDIGTYYGRSFMSKIIPFAMQVESLLESVMQNAADSNRFGFTLVPQDWEIMMSQVANLDGNPPILTYSSNEYNKDGLHQINPASVNDVPARVVTLALGAVDRLTAHGPALSGQAVGRADSQVAYQEIAEQGATSLLPKAESISHAHVTVFRRVLYNVRKRALAEPRAFERGLPLTRIDNSIAGIVIDPETGRVRITVDSLPDPYGVELEIASKDPQQKEKRKTEALGAYNAGMMTIDELRILNAKEGWNMPLGNAGTWENYVRAVLINLVMFGDGQKVGTLPGADPDSGNIGIFFDADFDRAHIHLLAVEDFTAGHEFHLASDEVVEAFKRRKRELSARVNNELPQGLEGPDQAAAAAAQQGAAGLRVVNG